MFPFDPLHLDLRESCLHAVASLRTRVELRHDAHLATVGETVLGRPSSADDILPAPGGSFTGVRACRPIANLLETSLDVLMPMIVRPLDDAIDVGHPAKALSACGGSPRERLLGRSIEWLI